MNKKNIIDGYKGIMPLDLTNVDEKLHSILIKQHYKDIHLNTVMSAEKIHKMEEDAQKERVKLLHKQQELEDQKRIELYYKHSK